MKNTEIWDSFLLFGSNQRFFRRIPAEYECL